MPVKTIKYKTVTLIDIILILTLIVVSFFTIPFLQSGKGDTLSIYIDNKKFASYPLSKDRHITIPGLLGELHCHIEKGAAFIGEVSCPNQICVQGGKISNGNEQLICAPNHILIKIDAPKGRGDEIDAISQ